MPVSPIDEDSNFVVISKASVYNTIFCCINGVHICGNKETINHSLCCISDVWKLSLAINVLTIWLKSQIDFVGSNLICLISMMHCDLDFDLLNSSIKPSQISLSVLGTNPAGTMENFIYQSSTRPRKVMIICDFLMFSSWICHIVQTTSHINQCFSGSSIPFPLNIGILMLVLAIGLIVSILTVGTVGTKFGLVRLPFLLFTALVLLVFT